MSLTNSLLLEENLVVDKAPGWKRVEFTFTPGEVRQAVEAGPALEMRGERWRGPQVPVSRHAFIASFFFQQKKITGQKAGIWRTL